MHSWLIVVTCSLNAASLNVKWGRLKGYQRSDPCKECTESKLKIVMMKDKVVVSVA
jgi:hypothetical protein